MKPRSRLESGYRLQLFVAPIGLDFSGGVYDSLVLIADDQG